MKKWLMVIAAAVGASVVKKNMDRTRADKDLWSQATGSSGGSPAKDAWATSTDTPAS